LVFFEDLKSRLKRSNQTNHPKRDKETTHDNQTSAKFNEALKYASFSPITIGSSNNLSKSSASFFPYVAFSREKKNDNKKLTPKSKTPPPPTYKHTLLKNILNTAKLFIDSSGPSGLPKRASSTTTAQRTNPFST
jgi:hypothetical protein